MKFSISISLERFDPSTDMREVQARALELVQIAEAGGFEIAWTPEHHTIELTIGPNPFLVLAQWAAHTKTIRLGTAVVVAPYWHPIRVAGEAAFVDVMSNGRLELGIGRGAYQYEFDRMAGRHAAGARRRLHEGDAARGERAVGGRLRAQGRILVVSARDLGAASAAAAVSADLGRGARSRHLRLGDQERRPHHEHAACRARPRRWKILGEKFEAAVAANPGVRRPRFLMLRRTCVYERHGMAGRRRSRPRSSTGATSRTCSRISAWFAWDFPEQVDYAKVANRGEYEPRTSRNT